MIQRLRTLYNEKVIPQLTEELGYTNRQQLPKIEKIQINRCLGLAASNSNILKKSIQEFTLITGQKPVITKSKKSIAGFKVREKMDLGITYLTR